MKATLQIIGLVPSGVTVFTLSAILLLLQIVPSLGDVRQAPFCVDDQHEPEELENFEPILKRYRLAPSEFVPVAPNSMQSPTGFISHLNLSHITTTTPYLPVAHTWRVFTNFLHVTIKANDFSGGMEGLYVQAISAPIGVPFGEFVTNFDCGDCENPTSAMLKYTSLLGCAFRPAISYIHPTVFVIGGRQIPPKFFEAHFHFRYVDYPCFDVMYAQFLIIAVRQFKPTLEYEVYYSPLYQTNIEGVGAPSPMYYGWSKDYIDCHDPESTSIDNWLPQKNSRVKVKFNEEYDLCVLNNNTEKKTGPGNSCPPGPVTCGAGVNDPIKPPKTISQWKRMRKDYLYQHNKEKGTEIFCYDCGTYTSHIGNITWEEPSVDTTTEEEVSIVEVYITKTINVKPKFGGVLCEKRNGFGKTVNGSRDTGKDKLGCENFRTRLINAGYRWGKRSLKLHALLMIFAFTVATNCLVYSARFLKETHIVGKGTGCWGIGNWLWDHIFWTYLSGAAMWAGFTMYAFQDKKVVCQIYDSKEDTDICNGTIRPHKMVGVMAVILFHMSYATGWARPNDRKMRDIVVGYHTVAGYLAKYLALICLALTPNSDFDWFTWTLITLLEVSFWVAFIGGTLVQVEMDKDDELKTIQGHRKMCPVPEGIATHLEPPYGKVRAILFPIFIIIQVGLFGVLFFYTLRDYVKIKK